VGALYARLVLDTLLVASHARLVLDALLGVVASSIISHLKEVLLVLRKNNLSTNVNKCTFCVDSVVFLGFIVNKNGVHVDPKKIKAI